MIDRRLRAIVLVTEAAALGLELEDLIAAQTVPVSPAPTLAEHLEAMAPTFSAGTAATYNSYWKLAIERLGDRRLTYITVVDLQLVVADAVRRARQRRPGSTGRSSEETCVAALRALFNRAGGRADRGEPCCGVDQAPAGSQPPPGPRRPRTRGADRGHPHHQR